MRRLVLRSFCSQSSLASRPRALRFQSSATASVRFGEMRSLDSETSKLNPQSHNNMLQSLERDGFFDCHRLEPLQLFLEQFSLDRLGLKWQRKLHRKLLLLLLDQNYPKLLKVAACLQLLDAVKKTPSELLELGLFDACMKFLFDHSGLLSLHELLLLYRHGHSVSFLSREECEFLEECIGAQLGQRGFESLPESCLVEFSWSLAFQRYRPLYSHLYSPVRQELTGRQLQLFRLALDRLSGMASLKRSFSLRK